jgi:predicted ATPase/class 3 adenylate cyclase
MAVGSADLLSFIPIDRRLALARGETLPDRAVGAALIADISGFTPLTEGLAVALGPQRGAEELTRHLDTFYGTLIEPIEQYGGSVVGFSGDAVTCWFDQDTGHRAIAAALTMQAAVRALPAIAIADGPMVQLAAKIAVAHGPVRRFVVGDPKLYRMDVLAGRLLNTLSALLADADREEVVVDEATAQRLGTLLVVDRHQAPGVVVLSLNETVAPNPWPAAPLATTQEAARAWVLPAVQARLRLSQGEFLADLRPAVALFLGFGGIDYDGDDDAGLLLDAYVRHVQVVLARIDGALVNLTIGDKGSYCLGVLGVPVAHDDDAVRGVGAALELRQPPAQLSFIGQVRIGLAQGPMYAGAYGCTDRRTYGVQGDKTNLAARLMEHAQAGEILCDDEVYRQAGRRWAFETLPALRAKGKAGLIRVYRPTGSSARAAEDVPGSSHSHQLVGRAAELNQIRASLTALQAGQGGLVTITGEAGIGKSRLVAVLARLARESGLTGLIGAGQSVEQQTAYRAWRDILGSFFDLDEVGDPAERRGRVQRIGQELIPRQLSRLPLLNDILALGLPETPITAALDPALRQESLIGLVVALLRAWVRERPLILVFEDAQWLDSLSWQLALQVARALLIEHGRLLLVLVSRDLPEGSEGARLVAACAGLAPVTHLALSPLAEDDTLALAASRLGVPVSGLPDPVVTLVRERAGGNPFFAEEIAYALRDRGLVRVEPAPTAPDILDEGAEAGRCVLTADLADVRAILPDTLQGLVLSRIDRLSTEQQFTLKIAAVIGRRFPYPPLRDTLETFGAQPDVTLADQVGAFIQHDLTILEATEPERAYLFKHIVIHEVAYQTLLYAQRRQLHQAVGRWYQARWVLAQGSRAPASSAAGDNAGPATTLLPLLVHHFHEAEALVEERQFARLAGQQAARKHANAEALHYLSRALDLTPEMDTEARFELLLAREAVNDLLGARQAQAQDVHHLEALAIQLGAAQQAEVLLRRSHYAYTTGDYAASAEAAHQAEALAASAGSVETEARAYLLWGMALWQQASYAEAQARNERALLLARRAGLASIEADCLRQQGILSDAQADYSAARKSLEAALRLHQAVQDPRGEAKCLNSLGVVAYNQEDYAAANGYYLASLKIKQEMGDRYGQGITLQNLGIVANEVGELDMAQTDFGQALALCREIGDREGEASALDGLGTTALRLADFEAAELYVLGALSLSRDIGDRVNESAHLTNLSTLRHAQGDHDTAGQHSLEALRIAQDIGARYYETVAWRHVGQSRLYLGQPAAAMEAFQAALHLSSELDKPRFSVEALTGLAAASLMLGQSDRALESVQRILPLIGGDASSDAGTPLLTYWTCYQVLAHVQDPRTSQILGRGYTLLEARAGKLADPQSRHRFIHDIPEHRAIQLAWQGRSSAEKGEG